MPKAYRIKRFSHVTSAKRRRLLEESLVPILDESAENAPDIQNFLKEGDLLIEYRESSKPLYLFKVKEYRHEPHIHLYVKHFIKADKIYKLDKSYITNDIHTLLDRANHLEALPQHLFDMFDRYQDMANTDPDEKIKHLIFLLELNRNVLGSVGKQFLWELDNGKITPAELKALLNRQLPKNEIVSKTKIVPAKPVEKLVDPSKVTGAISKSALDTYMKNHNGQLPTVKEFDKYTKRFMSGAGQRRRRR